MNTNSKGTVAPAENSAATQTNEKMNIPNNFDHMVISGLMEGNFSGPFDMDFEGNHTLVIGSTGLLALYRASRTAPVAFIAKGAHVHISAGMADCEVEVHAEGSGSEMTITVQNLSGINVVPVDSKWLSLEKGILEAAYDLEGRLGRRRIARILSGSSTISTVTGTLDSLKLFGRFTRYGTGEIVSKIDEMVQSGLLALNEKGGFPTVSITDTGTQRMKQLRTELGVVDLAFGDTQDKEAKVYVDALRQWRSEIGREAKLPPYLILRNDAIRNISRELPSDMESLAEVRGVGPTTLEKYGEAILDVLVNTTPA